jgi:hypothetical protein
MVIKRIRIPKSAKKNAKRAVMPVMIKGGEGENILDFNLTWDNVSVSKFLNNIIDLEQYNGLIKYIKDIFDREQETKPEPHTNNDDLHMTDSEIAAKAKSLSQRLVDTNNLEDTRTKCGLQRQGKMIVKPQDSVEIQPANYLQTTITSFNTHYISILNIVKTNLNIEEKSNLKDLIDIIKKLPYYQDSLTFLTQDSDNTEHTLKVSYFKILMVLQARCSGWAANICGMAASLAGADIYAFYNELQAKKNKYSPPDITYKSTNRGIDSIKELATKIPDEELLEFMNKIIPVLEKKLGNIDKFKEEINKIKALNVQIPVLCPVSSGGRVGARKSSKHTQAHKEILGKHMKIYKMSNDKKEYVKHKGTLITVKQYRDLMKIKADTKKRVSRNIKHKK